LQDPKIEVKRYEPGNFDDNGNLTSEKVKK